MGLIKNTQALAATPARTDALAIAEAAYAAIDTGAVVRSQLWFDGTTLHADGRAYDLAKYKRIHVLVSARHPVALSKRSARCSMGE